MPTITIDPTNPKKEHRAILAKLLADFKADQTQHVLKRDREDRSISHEVTLKNGETYSVKLKYSISKPFSSLSPRQDEFYVRTNEKLGQGAWGSVKRATYRLKLKGEDVSVLPGMMIYKRIKLNNYLNHTNNGNIHTFKQNVQNEIDMLNKRYPGLNIIMIEKQDDLDNYSVHFFAPFIPGKCLEQCDEQADIFWSATRSVDMKKKLSYARQLYRDLAFIHAQNIAHLDIKNGNILITNHGQLRCVDFGFTRDIDSDLKKAFGSWGHMAPEIFLIKSSNHGLADMYSSGLTFYGIITGEDGIDQIYQFVDNPHINYLQSKFDLGTAKEHFDKSTHHKELADIFNRFFINVSQKDFDLRLRSHQAEMLWGIVSSKLFDDYLLNNSLRFKESLKKDAATYSLQDLFYFVTYNKQKNEFNAALEVIFNKDQKKIADFSTALIKNKGSIKTLYKEKLSKMLHNLRAALGVLTKEEQQPTAINALIKFAKSSHACDFSKFNLLIDKIEKALEHLIDSQAENKNVAMVVAKVLHTLDPFILEQISPAVLEQAYELKPKEKVEMTHSLFTQPSKAEETETMTDLPKSPSPRNSENS